MKRIVLFAAAICAMSTFAAEPPSIPVPTITAISAPVKSKSRLPLISRTAKKQAQIFAPSTVGGLSWDDNDDDFVPDSSDLDIHRSNHYLKVVAVDELSDHILDRLSAAREKAMARYNEIWGDSV